MNLKKAFVSACNALREVGLNTAARYVARAHVWYDYHRLYGHWTDEARQDKQPGFHRRGWFYVGEPYHRTNVLSGHWEVKVPSRTFAFGVDVGGGDSDDEIMVKLCCPPIALYVGMEHQAVRKFVERMGAKGEMETQVRIFDSALWWDCWQTANEWHSGTPRWRHGNFRPVDFLFGKQDYVCETLSEHDVLIPMPERAYKAHVKLTHATWTRKRWPHWPLTLRKRGADVEMLKGEQIPSPGKGENSWDCDDDATFGLSCPAHTLEDAVGETVKCVLKSRRRYGGGTGTEPWVREPKVQEPSIHLEPPAVST